MFGERNEAFCQFFAQAASSLENFSEMIIPFSEKIAILAAIVYNKRVKEFPAGGGKDTKGKIMLDLIIKPQNKRGGRP